MSLIYKRLINEYIKISKLEDNFNYKLYTIDSYHIMFRCDINFFYNKLEYKIKIYYDKFYPVQSPLKIKINNDNIFNLYQEIIFKNSTLLNNNYLYQKSLLHNSNWTVSKNIIHILQEIKKVIDYNQLYIKRLLLNKIVLKYTNQHLDYLEQYLL